MSDLIDRQNAIDALKKIIFTHLFECGEYIGEDTREFSIMNAEKALDEIENIPSAEPEPKWIPCNARMPEEREWVGTKRFGTTVSDEVYVTFENPKGERFCKHLSFQNGKLSSFDQSTIDAFYPEAKPIAWMPLPEPWRGEK